MNSYNDYGLFLTTAIKRAMVNKKVEKPEGTFIEDMITILKNGWDTYMSTSSIMGRAGTAFSSTLACFKVSPIGLKLGTLGINNNIYDSLNQHTSYTNAVKEIGLKYKVKFDKHLGEKLYIEALLDEATLDLEKILDNNETKEIKKEDENSNEARSVFK